MTDFVTTPDVNFEGLDGYSFEPNYHAWQDMKVHYLDEGPKEGPVMLLLHGMPSWSYLYRDIIPLLVDAGYRCIAPDHLGFGKSDKPTDLHWFTIARHTEVLTSLVVELDLQDVTLVCQDWGGPIGLAQAATMPNRFSRLVIMNTWLHHEGYTYSDAIRNWNKNWQEGGLFARPKPNVGLLMAMSAGLISREVMFPALIAGEIPEFPTLEAKHNHDAFLAPFYNMPDHAFNGARRFPLSIPLDKQGLANGNAAAQQLHYNILLQWDKPVHFIWGCADDVFTQEWGVEWASRLSASFDAIPDAGHFLQNTHGKQVAEYILARI